MFHAWRSRSVRKHSSWPLGSLAHMGTREVYLIFSEFLPKTRRWESGCCVSAENEAKKKPQEFCKTRLSGLTLIPCCQNEKKLCLQQVSTHRILQLCWKYLQKKAIKRFLLVICHLAFQRSYQSCLAIHVSLSVAEFMPGIPDRFKAGLR